MLNHAGFCQRHPFGDREVLAGQREVLVIVTQAALPQGRLSQWKEHHPDHGGSLLLCKNFINAKIFFRVLKFLALKIGRVSYT